MPAAPHEGAALMAATGSIVQSSSSAPSTDGGSNNKINNATDALARSNLLRLETSELIHESLLHVHPTSGSGDVGNHHAHYEAKWAPTARDYLSHVKHVLENLDKATLSPDVAVLPGGAKEKGMEHLAKSETKYRIPLLSDKFAKTSLEGSNSNHNPLTSWSFPFGGGSTLSFHPIGSFAHVGNAGLANRHANGNVLPVLDVAVLVDGESLDVGGKDYLNHRYTDKRNILAVHIAKQLSQKKHRSKIGAVHQSHILGDSRKVGLMLTPPSDSNVDDSKKDKKKRKRSKDADKSKSKGKKNKLRFRVRLVFGIKQDRGSNPVHEQHDDAEYSSSDEETENAWNGWIPRSRLLPNRSNNRSEKRNDGDAADANSPTPHYTNALAEDLHLLSTTDLVSSTLSTLTSTSGSNVTPTSSFHETLLLLKVWALQRGFLRGHDSFTTTTLAVLLVYLYRTKGIGKRMGAVQGLTAFMKFWSESDWLGEDATSSLSGGAAETLSSKDAKGRKAKKKVACVIPAEGKTESQTIAKCPQSRLYLDDVRGTRDCSTPKTLLDCYRECYTSSSASSNVANDAHVDSPILLDPTMTINYLARLSPSFIRESRAEAHTALRCIHSQEQMGTRGTFQKLFLETNRFWTRYDAYVKVPLAVVPKLLGTVGGGSSKKKHGKTSAANASNKVWGNDVNDLGYDESVCRGAVEVLSRALGKRATAIRAFTCGNGDFQSPSNTNEADSEDVATKIIADSDQCHAVPIRGIVSHNFGYAARAGDRVPVSPVLADTTSNNREEPCLVVGLSIDPDASRHVVDRGPPAEDVDGSAAFVALWGEKHAQLRRFQDGAIVRAVVWNNAAAATTVGGGNVQFHGMDRSMGGIVERIVQHVVQLHFTDAKVSKKRKESKSVAFELRNMLSFIDGVAAVPSSPAQSSSLADSLALHKNAMSAFESLSEFLRRNTSTTFESSIGRGKKTSKLGLPLSVDEVEPLSPCLRYSALFPPVPHPLLGGPSDIGSDKRKVSGANFGSPILIQIRFEGSSKWPTSLNAMGAAKCAMLAQLAEGIEKMKQVKENGNGDDLDAFDGPMDVTPNYLDIGYRGYSWRIIVRADQELRMLRSLGNPTVEAKALQLSLIDRHVRGAMHHSLIHAVHTRHPSASSVVRLSHRWVASHMLSDMIPQEAVELMVAKIYATASEEEEEKSNNPKIGRVVDRPPSTVVAGFLKFLQLLSGHDWAREPLIVDPQNHISPHDRGLIHAQFNDVRGPELRYGPAMYIVSPADYDGVEGMVGSKVVGDSTGSTFQQQTAMAANNAAEKIWSPTVTAKFPEKVVLSRASALAKCSHNHLTTCIRSGKVGNNGWVAAFQESSTSLTSYSALLRVDPSYITDSGCSSTNADCSIPGAARSNNQDNGVEELSCGPFEKSLQKRYAGPKELRKKHYKNLVLAKDTLHEWQPVSALVKDLRSKYKDYAVFFYNEFAPDIIGMVWRPDAFKPQPFSAVVSEFKRPAMEYWKEDNLVITNTDDVMAEIGYCSKNIVSNIKVFDDRKPDDAPLEKHPKKSRQEDDVSESSDSDEE